jgi:hypothetical protein
MVSKMRCRVFFLVAQAQVQRFHIEFTLRRMEAVRRLGPRALDIAGSRLQNISSPNERPDTERR